MYVQVTIDFYCRYFTAIHIISRRSVHKGVIRINDDDDDDDDDAVFLMDCLSCVQFCFSRSR
jgi:hypothetical protein